MVKTKVVCMCNAVGAMIAYYFNGFVNSIYRQLSAIG